MKDWYKDWFDSPYYDLLYNDRDESEAREFISYIATRFNIKERHKILDIPCGNGRHCLALSNTGAEITGIDLSFRNIKQAKSLENERLNFFIHDMRNVYRINYFDFVLNLFTSFGYFDTAKENLNAARSISLNLKPGGIFLLDYFNPDPCVSKLIQEEDIFFNNVRFIIKRTQIADSIVKDIHVMDGRNEYDFQERVKLYRLQDLKIIFQNFGLEFMDVFGDYKLKSFEPERSERMIVLFKKQMHD